MNTRQTNLEPPAGMNGPASTQTAARNGAPRERRAVTRRDWLRTAALTPLAAAALTSPVAAVAAAAETVKARTPASLDEFPAHAVRLYMQEDRGCGETMLLAGCQALGLPADQAGAMGLGLSGGLGLQGKTCACVVSGAQLLSLAAASPDADPTARKKQVYGTVGNFVKQFAAEFGATDCRALCGVDLTIPEELKRFKATIKGTVCRRIIERTARLLAQTIVALPGPETKPAENNGLVK